MGGDDAAPRPCFASSQGARLAESALNLTPESLARRLGKSKLFRVRFTAHDGLTQVAEFQTAGFDQLVGRIAEPCGWKP